MDVSVCSLAVFVFKLKLTQLTHQAHRPNRKYKAVYTVFKTLICLRKIKICHGLSQIKLSGTYLLRCECECWSELIWGSTSAGPVRSPLVPWWGCVQQQCAALWNSWCASLFVKVPEDLLSAHVSSTQRRLTLSSLLRLINTAAAGWQVKG